jgi:hypothetical protein
VVWGVGNRNKAEHTGLSSGWAWLKVCTLTLEQQLVLFMELAGEVAHC